MTTDVMLDIETLGTGSDAMILSIGAVKFNPRGAGVDNRFYVKVDPEDAAKYGKIDVSTVMWWMEQNEFARKELTDKANRITLIQSLFKLNDFVAKDCPVWGNGASFDNVIIRHAFSQAGVTPVWKFWNDKCYRTMKGLRPDIKLERKGTYHNALDDAESKANHLQAIFRGLK